MRSRFFVLGIAALTTGCLQPIDTSVSSISMTGTWQYSGSQSGSSGALLQGSMVLAPKATGGFQGTVNLVSTSPDTGESKVVAGTVSGFATSEEAIDFDLYLDQVPRRHVAQLVAGRLTGTWINLTGNGTAASGTFTATRVGQ